VRNRFYHSFFITIHEPPDMRTVGVLEMLYDIVKSTAPIYHERVWRAENITTSIRVSNLRAEDNDTRSIFLVRIICFCVSFIATLYLDWILHISYVNLNEKKKKKETWKSKFHTLTQHRAARSFMHGRQFILKNVATYPIIFSTEKTSRNHKS